MRNPFLNILEEAIATQMDLFRPESIEKMEVDRFLYALNVAAPEENLSPIDDDILAQELQLQEVLIASANSTKRCKDSTSRLESDPRCDICKQLIPPSDVLAVPPPCPHALCKACLCRYVDDVLGRHRNFTVKCPHASCDALLQPELYREFVASRLFQGDCSRDAVVKLMTTVLDVLEDDSKGKQIVVSPASAMELGESSSVGGGGSEFHCGICMETRKTTDGFDVERCSHKFCRSCMKSYVTAKVEQNATSIGCPDPECKEGTLDPETCREILPKAVFDRWGDALCEAAVGVDKFYCPYRDCSALLMNNGGGCGDEVMTEAECPHCHRMLCAQCKVPWHVGIDCKGFQELGDDERGREDIMLRYLATDNKWQRCPQCRMYVEKIDGCMFISCRCGFGFCYICASPMSKYLHYCEKCLR